MLKVYYLTQSRAVRPRWLLEELGVPYELVRIDRGDLKKPEYLKINPNGTVPALSDGDLNLFESAAICEYLADKFPEKRMAPPLGTPARGLYYQWMHWAMCTIEPPVVTIFINTVMRPEAERIQAVLPAAREGLTAALKVAEAALTGRDYILGAEFSAADVLLGSTLSWTRMMGLLGEDHPTVAAYVGRVTARPAFKRATAD